MAAKRVRGVLWWEMQLSHFKAIYRRSNVSGYTKDFLQCPRDLGEEVIPQLFGGRVLTTRTEYPAVTYRWPGGTFAGKIYRASDRVEVGQWTTGAPEPWQVGDPNTNPTITFGGDPDAPIPNGADAVWTETLEEQEPWLVMVQLEGEDREFHLRAYLGAPPPELLDADFETIPAELRTQMRGRGGLVRGLPELWFDPDRLRHSWTTTAEPDPGETVPESPPEPGDEVGSEYRPADENVRSTSSGPFEVDPDERDRSTRAHAVTQNALADAVRARGFTPTSPTSGDPNFDLAWEESDGTLVVAEVKSVKPRNAERQLRLGLGQVLRYRDVLTGERAVRGLLVLSGEPPDPRWIALCDSLDIGLIWLPGLDAGLNAWLQ
jgi:hypothetical protein